MWKQRSSAWLFAVLMGLLALIFLAAGGIVAGFMFFGIAAIFAGYAWHYQNEQDQICANHQESLGRIEHYVPPRHIAPVYHTTPFHYAAPPPGPSYAHAQQTHAQGMAMLQQAQALYAQGQRQPSRGVDKCPNCGAPSVAGGHGQCGFCNAHY